MFIGIDVGIVFKVVLIFKEMWYDLEEVLLEEMIVFWELIIILVMEFFIK